MMGWIDLKTFRFFLPAINNKFIRSESSESFEALSKVVSIQKIIEMLFELKVALIIITFNGSLFNCSIHTLHLSISPGMVHFRKSVFNFMFVANTIKDMRICPFIFL